MVTDSVNHPKHYNSHPSGVECITITEHMNFNIGNAVKYLWRAGLKGEGSPLMQATEAQLRAQQKHIEDLQKAAWYINREIFRLCPLLVAFDPASPGDDHTVITTMRKRDDGTLEVVNSYVLR